MTALPTRHIKRVSHHRGTDEVKKREEEAHGCPTNQKVANNNGTMTMSSFGKVNRRQQF